MIMGNSLFRPYIKGTKRPITRIWYRTRNEASDSAKYFIGNNQEFEVIEKDINSVVKNRKKTGFRGLI